MSELLNFGPLMFKTKLSDVICDSLMTRAENNTINMTTELAGNLHKETSFDENDKQWFANIIKGDFEEYKRQSDIMSDFDGVGYSWKLSSLWINYMRPGDYNPPHTHSADYSFVLFLNVPEEIEDENMNFRGNSEGPGRLTFDFGEGMRKRWFCMSRTFLPKKGDFFIFPALLRHYVHPFKSDVTRVSVSGNIEVQPKEEVKNYF
tara:strand:+ start:66 stop:680 length:615 start_codon:yes stop_codon:yes gene_type:complete